VYCPSCGVALAHGLSYCNYCGAKLSGGKADPKSSEVRAELVVSAMVALFVFGLAAMALFLLVMKEGAGFDLPFLLVFTAFSFVMMLMVEGVFMWLLLRRKKSPKTVVDAESAKGQNTRELEGKQSLALQEPLASVTEHTTRAFEPAYSERESK
jgi:hypothetical protein